MSFGPIESQIWVSQIATETPQRIDGRPRPRSGMRTGVAPRGRRCQACAGSSNEAVGFRYFAALLAVLESSTRYLITAYLVCCCSTGTANVVLLVWSWDVVVAPKVPLVELPFVVVGYRDNGGTWRHPSRSVVFVGDLIDRGPKQLATVDLVRRMVEAGSARCVMGNHEPPHLCKSSRSPCTPNAPCDSPTRSIHPSMSDSGPSTAAADPWRPDASTHARCAKG